MDAAERVTPVVVVEVAPERGVEQAADLGQPFGGGVLRAEPLDGGQAASSSPLRRWRLSQPESWSPTSAIDDPACANASPIRAE